MKRIVINTGSKFISDKKNSKRGAEVFGLPVSPAVNSYLDDVSPQARQHRMLAMFFAGNYSTLEEATDFDFDQEDDEL